VEIKRWSITANRENSKKAFLELKMLKVNRFAFLFSHFAIETVHLLVVVTAFNSQKHRQAFKFILQRQQIISRNGCNARQFE
jgi:hypothetical protein